jgi:hypothetical protein
MFWCLYFLKDNIYFIEELDTLVLYKRQKNLITIFDIVARKIPPFSEIYPCISHEDDKTAEFLFMTDKINLDGTERTKLTKDNGTHLYGHFPLEDRRFIFPYTSHA